MLRLIWFAIMLTLVLFPAAAKAETHTVLASFEQGSDILDWLQRDGAQAERVAGETTHGDYYLHFKYRAQPLGWPALVLQAPALRVTDWSHYDVMSVDLYNPERASLTLILRLDDDMGNRYNRQVQLPPQAWTRWNIPIAEINLDAGRIVAAHFHFDRPRVAGAIYLDNWRLVKGEVAALKAPGSGIAAAEAIDITSLEPHYRVVVTDTMTKIPIDTPYTGSMRTEAHINAAGGEAEGFQLVLIPHGLDLREVRITATPLKQVAGSAVIPAENFTFNQVGYVKTDWPFYSVERAGWWPDPLLNPENFDVKSGDVQPVWVTVRVPEHTPPGVYQAVVTVTSTNTEPTEIPVTLRVWNFTLPREGSLPLAFTYFEDIAEQIHGIEAWYKQGLKHKYYDLILEHRIGPDNIYRRTPPFTADVTYWNERGLTAFNITQVGSKAYYTPQEIQDILATIERSLALYKDAQVDHKAYVYGFDEIGPEIYPGLRQMFGAVGERFPGLKRLVAARIAPEVYGYVDAWANTIETYNPALAEQRRAAGEEVWLYLSMSGRHPYPNWFIEYPAIEARLVWWLGYLYDIDGFLYYAINHYDYRNGQLPTPIDVNAGPYVQWDPASYVSTGGAKFNGDGLLIYAGDNGPLASIRLANIRDGLEDYEYLRLLEKLLVERGKATDVTEATKQVKALFPAVVSGLASYTQDPQELQDTRIQIAEMIESLL